MTQNELFCPHSCFIDHFFLVPDFRLLPCQYFLLNFPFFLRCCLCIWYFSCLRHRNEFVHQTVMSCRIPPLCINVFLMRFVSRYFEHWSRAFVDINNTSVFSLVFPNIAVFSHCSLTVFCMALVQASELPTFYERLSL